MEEKSSRNTKPLPVKKNWIQRLATRRGMFLLATASLILIILAGIGGMYIWRAGSLADIQPKITPPSSLGDLATEYPELGSILQDPKLDSVYKEFLVVYQEKGPEAAYELARTRGLLNPEDELRLTLELNTTDSSALQDQLEAQGIKITAASGNLIDISIPLSTLMQIMASGDPGDFLKSITDLDQVRRVRVPYTTTRDAGPVGLESLAMIAADSWQAAGYTGKGVKVAILDGGFDGYQDLLGTDLPADVTTRSFVSGWEIDQMGTVHGTACAEIVHDIAPDAELFLVTAETVAEFDQAVDWLIAQGVDVISHSGGWLYGPKDGQSTPSQIVDNAFNNGVLWVNSSGNYAYSHYRATFTDEDGDGYHEFSSGDEMMYFEPDGQVQMVLNWDDWDVGNQNFDLYVVDADGNEIASSENVQSGPEDSVEMIMYDFPDSGPYYIVFYGAHVTHSAVLDFYIPDTDIEYYTIEYSLNTPGDAPSALTVGATNWEDDTLEYYSSQGPTEDDRLKPEISAPARVSTSSYKGKQFYGTSASTPHVAGAAALVLEAFPNFGPQEVSDYLLTHSLDYGPNGPDYGYGYGRLWLGEPPDFSVEPTPTTEQVAVLPTGTSRPSDTLAAPTPLASLPTAERRPTLTPVPGSSGGSGDWGAGLALLACVVIPGLMGVGGIGLLGGVWYLNRSRQASARQPGYPPPPRAVAPEERGRELQASPQSQDMCPRCGAPHRMDAQFCQKCGLSLRWGVPDAAPSPRCKNCGHFLRPESKFCPHCGQPT